MGDVGAVRYEPALLPPCLTIRVLSYSNCKSEWISDSYCSLKPLWSGMGEVVQSFKTFNAEL